MMITKGHHRKSLFYPLTPKENTMAHTVSFIFLSDLIVATNLNDEEQEALSEVLCDGDATFGSNAFSLVTGAYIASEILDQLNEDWSGKLLDKMQRYLYDECDDKDIYINLES
jgi:hypothetical protein